MNPSFSWIISKKYIITYDLQIYIVKCTIIIHCKYMYIYICIYISILFSKNKRNQGFFFKYITSLKLSSHLKIRHPKALTAVTEFSYPTFHSMSHSIPCSCTQWICMNLAKTTKTTRISTGQIIRSNQKLEYNQKIERKGSGCARMSSFSGEGC